MENLKTEEYLSSLGRYYKAEEEVKKASSNILEVAIKLAAIKEYGAVATDTIKEETLTAEQFLAAAEKEYAEAKKALASAKTEYSARVKEAIAAEEEEDDIPLF